MNTLENKIADILIDLKENYNALSVKAEFETEGTTLEEAAILKELADKSELKFTVKIGGCEAVKDLSDTKHLCADEIVAPMIETPYALKKYIKAVNRVFSKEEKSLIKTFINIETITGYNNLQDIILTDEFLDISGIVLGRDDMAASMDLTIDKTDSDIMLNIAHKMSEKMQFAKKDFIIGGNITPKSQEFFSKIPYLTRYETRKVIFGNSRSSNIPNGIKKAIEFEIMWIQNRRNNYGITMQNDDQRINLLKSRYNGITEKTEC